MVYHVFAQLFQVNIILLLFETSTPTTKEILDSFTSDQLRAGYSGQYLRGTGSRHSFRNKLVILIHRDAIRVDILAHFERYNS